MQFAADAETSIAATAAVATIPTARVAAAVMIGSRPVAPVVAKVSRLAGRIVLPVCAAPGETNRKTCDSDNTQDHEYSHAQSCHKSFSELVFKNELRACDLSLRTCAVAA
jgi:hypothetical protein